MMRTTVRWTLLLTALALTGCSGLNLRQALKAPTATVERAHITGLSFSQVDLAFDVAVDNPNPVALKLAALDYDLHINSTSFLKGQQAKSLTLAAGGVSHITLPLSLGFDKLYRTYQGLREKDAADYTLDLGLAVDLPLLGRVRKPLKVSGSVPLPKLPLVHVLDLKVERLDLSGARLALKLQVDNPNGFSLLLDRLAYAFNVEGTQWADGAAHAPGAIGANGSGTVTLPIVLDFRAMGLGLYALLNSDQGLHYRLTGDLDATSSNALLGHFTLPIDRGGVVKLSGGGR